MIFLHKKREPAMILMDQVLEQLPIGIVYHCCNAYQKETSASCACFFESADIGEYWGSEGIIPPYPPWSHRRSYGRALWDRWPCG